LIPAAPEADNSSSIMNIGDRIGDYEILDELGRGGMGRVFRVRHVIADRVEAMKVLLPDLLGRQDLAARFLREIKVLAALNHPNVAALRTAFTAGNQLVMIMEYVEGQSLAERLARGPIAQGDAIGYVGQVLDALACAHDRGVVHRDIKPANMMLTPGGVVKLTDFGIARSATDETITVAGTTTGSLAYMAPEQVNGEATDARSDLYAVGISLYEMVTGRRPFRADSDFHVMLAHLKEPPRPPIELQPSLSPAVNDIILRAIAKPPDERFQSADEFRQALGALPVLLSAPAQATDDLTRTAAGSRTDAGRQAPDRRPAPMDPPVSRAPPGAVPHTNAARLPARQPVATRSGHPLLFVALGAALVIVALVGTGLYLGRAEAGPDRTAPAAAAAGADAHADSATPARAAGDDPFRDPDSAAPATTPPPSGTVPAGEPTLTRPAAAAPGKAAAGTAPTRPAADRATPPPVPTSTAAPVQSQAPPAAGSPPDTSGAAGATVGSSDAPQPSPAHPPADAELEAIDGELDQLAVRASALASSLNRLREQQARQGLGLRADMVARLESMRVNLSRAQEAVDRGDAARAAKLHDAARRDIEALERFLGL
jgi:eukaryotic-like serine/threonine-protein kinase